MRVGVDEAGKGPVLGSMFVAAVRAAPADLPAAVADSKTLSTARREELATAIRAASAAVAVVEIPVDRIDDPSTDMNGLAVAGHARALQRLGAPATPAVLDACDTDAARFERRVADRVSGDGSLTAEHGADETDPVVSAASILAKVSRDAHVETLADQYGAVGSGYPGDERTRTFLETYVAEHGSLPPCARSSWQTSQDVLAAAAQSGLSEF